ncbi:MAG: response regulator transcription factor [Burkholderiales bacterium]
MTHDAKEGLRILLADDHALFRAGMRHVLRELDASVVLLEAKDGAEALSLLTHDSRLDLVLLDLAMPHMDGLGGLAALRQRAPAVPIVILSASENTHDMRAALDAGAMGFIPKASPAAVVLGALRLVLAGGVYVPPEMIHPSALTATIPTAGGGSQTLTPRQVDILKLLGQGKSNKEIAQLLALTEGTVKQHVSDVLNALNVSNRTQAALVAGNWLRLHGADEET